MLSKKSQTYLRPIPAKDETRDDCPSICPQASCRSHRRVRRLMMLPPTQLRDGRPYGSENLRSAMQKDFFDSIDPQRTFGELLRSYPRKALAVLTWLKVAPETGICMRRCCLVAKPRSAFQKAKH